MNLVNCENPRLVRNKYTGKYVTVSCGKCATCKRTIANKWISRLECERANVKYTFFTTLTIADEFLTWVDIPSLLSSDPMDYSNWTDNDFIYCNEMESIPVLSVSDVQKFIKRLRYYAKKYNSKIRYYVVGEYGTRFFRPHYHILFFFESDSLASVFADLVAKAWPFGRVDTQSVKSSAASYCAEYLNSTSHLPAIYSHPAISQFSLKSVHEPLGASALQPTQVQELFHNSSVEMLSYSMREQSFVHVPLWRYLENRLFPKLLGYTDFNSCDRQFLYEVIYRKSVSMSKEEFIKWCTSCADSKSFYLLHVYMCYITHVPLHDFIVEPSYSNYIYLYYLGHHVRDLIVKFDVTFKYVFERIEEHYNNKAIYLLRKQYEFQSDFVSKGNDVRELVNMDFEFSRSSLLKLSYPTHDYAKTLYSYGYKDTEICFGLDLFSYENTSDYKDMCAKNKHILDAHTKIKDANDFIKNHKYYLLNSFYKPILNYHNYGDNHTV